MGRQKPPQFVYGCVAVLAAAVVLYGSAGGLAAAENAQGGEAAVPSEPTPPAVGEAPSDGAPGRTLA